MEQITRNVYVETGNRGCNPGFVVTSEGIVIVDSPQRPTDALKFREEVLKRGEIKFLINTEHHIDHWSGNYFFDAIFVAHQATREGIERIWAKQVAFDEECKKLKITDPGHKPEFDRNSIGIPIKERIKIIDPDYALQMEPYTVKLPTITFEKRMKLYVGNHSFELIHLPGHTPTVTAVFIPQERVVFTGDNIFHKVQTFLHESLPMDWLKSLDYLQQLEVDYLVPGHGHVCSKDYLEEQASFIRKWVASVREAVNKGWSMEEARERISFLDDYPMGEGLKGLGKELQKMNVSRLYHLIRTGEI
jgi:cyclase